MIFICYTMHRPLLFNPFAAFAGRMACTRHWALKIGVRACVVRLYSTQFTTSCHMHIAVCISGLKLWYSCRYRILSFNYAFWWWKHVKTHVCLSTSEMLLQKSVTVPTVDVRSFCWSTFEFSWSNPNFLLVKSKFWSVVMAHGFLKETISQIRMVNHILYIYPYIYVYIFIPHLPGEGC